VNESDDRYLFGFVYLICPAAYLAYRFWHELAFFVLPCLASAFLLGSLWLWLCELGSVSYKRLALLLPASLLFLILLAGFPTAPKATLLRHFTLAFWVGAFGGAPLWFFYRARKADRCEIVNWKARLAAMSNNVARWKDTAEGFRTSCALYEREVERLESLIPPKPAPEAVPAAPPSSGVFGPNPFGPPIA